MSTAETRTGDPPVLNFDYTATKPAGSWFKTYDELRERFPWFRNDFGPGFWTVVNYQGILQIMQDPETFSNSVVTALDPVAPAARPAVRPGRHREPGRHRAPARGRTYR
jgi:cytochrome P450